MSLRCTGNAGGRGDRATSAARPSETAGDAQGRRLGAGGQKEAGGEAGYQKKNKKQKGRLEVQERRGEKLAALGGQRELKQALQRLPVQMVELEAGGGQERRRGGRRRERQYQIYQYQISREDSSRASRDDV